MFAKLLKYAGAALFAALFAVSSISPTSAVVVDPQVLTGQKIIPARTCASGQNVCFLRVTVNFNDPSISTGVWFDTLPPNVYILGIDAHVTTAFNAGTTNVVTLGATRSSANEILASGITAGSTGIYHLTSAAGLGLAVTGNTTYQTAINGAVPVYVKYAQTGTAATAGSVTIVLTYAKNDDK